MQMVPLYKILSDLGYRPNKGQSSAIGRALTKLYKFRCPHLYDLESRKQLAHVDLDRISVDKVKKAVALVKVVDFAPPKVGKGVVTKVEKTPPLAIEEPKCEEPEPSLPTKPAVYSALDALMELMRPSVDLKPLLDEIHAMHDRVAFIHGVVTGLSEAMASLRKEVKESVEANYAALATHELYHQQPVKSTIPVAPEPHAEAIAKWLEALAGERPDQLVQYMAAAEAVQALAEPKEVVWDYDLPLTAVWQGKQWINLSYTDNFLKDWKGLTKEQQKAVRHMLALLTQNPYHTSLKTHRRKYKEPNPPGVDNDAVYSRASDNVRVYWLRVSDDEVEFQKIVVKAG